MWHGGTKRSGRPDHDDTAEECKTMANIECGSPAARQFKSQEKQSTPLTWSKEPGGKKLLSIGPAISSWANTKIRKVQIRKAGPHVPPNVRHMFEILKQISDVRTRVCRTYGRILMAKWAEKTKTEEISVTSNVRTRMQKKYRTWGRVCWEIETKQNPNVPVLLEGCRKPPRFSNRDYRYEVELDFSDVRHCTVFPGQLLAVEGVNLTEDVMRVGEIFNETFIPSAPAPRITETLKIMAASGPFTTADNLDYEPLWDLMERAAEDEPHILILIGPFLDYNHQIIQNDLISCSYTEFFNKLVTKIMGYLTGKCTQVLLVASNKDAQHFAVYPTPEYNLQNHAQNPNLYVFPDPCMLDIEGLRIGITSVDILMHLGREEVVIKPSPVDKFTRLANYIINQACYYPLYPNSPEINLDSELWEKYAFFREKPHIMLLPSDLRYFGKQIEETLVLNPERLCKRVFTRINVTPSSTGNWSPNNVSCEIIKV